eukprot:6486050-Prorocentrum_lima.AAC.1
MCGIATPNGWRACLHSSTSAWIWNSNTIWISSARELPKDNWTKQFAFEALPSLGPSLELPPGRSTQPAKTRRLFEQWIAYITVKIGTWGAHC